MGVATAFKSLDSLLGPGDERFFATGFRKAKQKISDVVICPYHKEEENKGKITAKASLWYPNDWSKKEETKVLKPHLTSIDAVVIAVQLNEMYIMHKYTLTEEQRKEIWIRSLTMKAGTTPNEDLEGFDISSRQLSINRFEDKDQHISVFEAMIGNIQIKTEIIHMVNEVCLETSSYESAEILLGSTFNRYYGEGYKDPKQIIGDVDITSTGVYSTVTIEQPENINSISFGTEGNTDLLLQ